MRKLFGFANEYVRQSDWRDIALVKVCLAALGVILGLCVPKKHKTPVLLLAMSVFFFTCVPQLIKFLKIIFGGTEEEA